MYYEECVCGHIGNQHFEANMVRRDIWANKIKKSDSPDKGCQVCDCPEYRKDEIKAEQREKERKLAQERAQKERLRKLQEIDSKGVVDLLGKPYGVGDWIAWPTSAGRAVGMTVGKVTKINKKDTRVSVSQRKYTVQAKPIEAGYSGHYYSGTRYDAKLGKHIPREEGIRPVTIQKVQNIVKVEPIERNEQTSLL